MSYSRELSLSPESWVSLRSQSATDTVLMEKSGATGKGQAIYIDPTAEMVLIRLASSDKASNTLLDPMSLPAYQAVADYLLGK